MNDYELYHASNRRHKYIKKIGKRYFYSQEEIDAYKKQQYADLERKRNRIDVVRGMGKDDTDALAEYAVAKQEIQREEAKEAAKAKRRKKIKKASSKALKSLKKQTRRGMKAVDRWYTKATSPDITVTYDEAKIK